MDPQLYSVVSAVQILVINTVTESRVWMLAVQKPTKRQAWWKGKFVELALFWIPAMGKEEVRMSVQRSTPHPQPNNLGQELLQTEKCATCTNSTVSSDSHLETGHW